MRTGVYRHYKGGYYQLIGVGEHTETGEDLVVYVALDASLPGKRLRVRPLHGSDGWESEISPGVPRFQWERE